LQFIVQNIKPAEWDVLYINKYYIFYTVVNFYVKIGVMELYYLDAAPALGRKEKYAAPAQMLGLYSYKFKKFNKYFALGLRAGGSVYSKMMRLRPRLWLQNTC
jgi:hypothetical protein